MYLASESTFARVLSEHCQTALRGRAKAPRAKRPPTTHIATGVSQVLYWDMTYLPATVFCRWFHLYLILDLYSRKIMCWEVHANDSSDHAVHLVRRTAKYRTEFPAKGFAALEAARLGCCICAIQNVTPSSRSTRRLTLFSSWLRKLGDNHLDARRFHQ